MSDFSVKGPWVMIVWCHIPISMVKVLVFVKIVGYVCGHVFFLEYQKKGWGPLKRMYRFVFIWPKL